MSTRISNVRLSGGRNLLLSFPSLSILWNNGQISDEQPFYFLNWASHGQLGEVRINNNSGIFTFHTLQFFQFGKEMTNLASDYSSQHQWQTQMPEIIQGCKDIFLSTISILHDTSLWFIQIDCFSKPYLVSCWYKDGKYHPIVPTNEQSLNDHKLPNKATYNFIRNQPFLQVWKSVKRENGRAMWA